MLRARVVLGILALILVVGGVSVGQEKKTTSKGRSLPPNWGKLGLSDEQRQKIYSIQADFGAKIQDLQAKIKELQKQERAEMDKVLTDAQKAKLRELLLEKAGGAGDKSTSDKK